MDIKPGETIWYDNDIVVLHFYTEHCAVCVKEGRFVRYLTEPFLQDAIVLLDDER